MQLVAGMFQTVEVGTQQQLFVLADITVTLRLPLRHHHMQNVQDQRGQLPTRWSVENFTHLLKHTATISFICTTHPHIFSIKIQYSNTN